MRNPRPISDELTMDLYKKSNMPLKTYFETIAALAVRGCYNTSLEIIKDKVNMDNIDEAIYEYNNFIKPWHKDHINQEVFDSVLEVLKEIKDDRLINLFIDKESYIKKITDDKIINLTGQSGSGKSTYANNHFNSDEYLVIDTDDIFSDHRYQNATGINKELGTYFREKYDVLPNCGDDFDLIYKEILDYTKNYDKTIVIDCAQFHCIKDIGLLKGKMIIIRTSINNCYNRTIERYKKLYSNYTEEELNNYKEKKKAIFKWYKFSNEFIKKIDEL
jgi:adenylate kinase family enzyme